MNQSNLGRFFPLTSAILSTLTGSLLIAGCGGDVDDFDAVSGAGALMAEVTTHGAVPLRPPDKYNIVGGSAASAGQYPYMASLRQGISSYHACGAVLYNARTAITAAHCVVGLKTASIRYGSLQHASGGKLSYTNRIIMHAGYNPNTLENDIALLIFSSDLTNITPVALPSPGSDPASGTTVWVAGWGNTSQGGSLSANLMHVDLSIVARTTCQSKYGTALVTDNMICAAAIEGGKDACQGDSGGPLVDQTRSQLLGITSGGNGCAQPGYPGVYTRIGNYVNWIQQNAY